MIKKLSLLLLLIAFLRFGLQAQNYDEEALIQRRAAEMVSQLGDYLNYMADKNKKLSLRQRYRDKALNLFISKGEPYKLGGREFPAVSMQTTSTNSKVVKTTPMGEYFTNLINIKYRNVSLTTTEVGKIKVSSLKKIDEDTYQCTCYIEQVFRGYGTDGRPLYGDITRKSVQCIISVEQTIDGTEYIVRLGNITATHTERI